MCKGVAVLVNFEEVVIGNSSLHHEEVKNKDDYLALNVIYDNRRKCGYRIEPDTHDDEKVIEHYHKKLFYLNGKPNPKLMAKARKAIKENEAKVFRVLCENMQSAKTGDVNFKSANTGDVWFRSAKIGNVWFDSANIKELFINNLRIRNDKELTKLIAEFSKDKLFLECAQSEFV